GREIRAVEVRHRDVFDAVDFPEVVNSHDILVSDLARKDELLLEPALHFSSCRGIARSFRANDFQRHRVSELRVPDLVDGAHAADAENLKDKVARAERLTDAKRT